MKQKYIKFFTKDSPSNMGWNQTMFFNSKVVSPPQMQEFKAGKRLTIEIMVPHLKKKYYLYAWNEDGLADTILNSGLAEGDIISVYTELTYYKNKDGRYCEAYRIRPNIAFKEGMEETENFFSLMRIVREDKKSEVTSDKLSTDDLVKMLLGN